MESFARTEDRRRADAAVRVAHARPISGSATSTALREFIDWAAAIGFKLVQLLPINEMGGDNSPYNAISAMAIEPTTLHLAPGSPADLTRARISMKSSPALTARKVALRGGEIPEGAAFEARASGKGVRAFRSAHEPARVVSCLLRNGEVVARRLRLFPRAHGRERRERSLGPMAARSTTLGQRARLAGGATPEARQRFAEREAFFRYVQWVAYDQWIAAKAYADERGVALMGDIPFGVSYYSADVFARRGTIRSRLVGRRAAGTLFQGRRVHPEMGTELGHPALSLGRDAARQLRVVAAAGARRATHLSRLPHRSRARVSIASMPFRGGRSAIRNFCHLSIEEMLATHRRPRAALRAAR